MKPGVRQTLRLQLWLLGASLTLCWIPAARERLLWLIPALLSGIQLRHYLGGNVREVSRMAYLHIILTTCAIGVITARMSSPLAGAALGVACALPLLALEWRLQRQRGPLTSLHDLPRPSFPPRDAHE